MREQLHPALSQLFVAYVTEFDNAVEGWLPHRTSRFGDGGPPPPAPRNGHPFRRPWLVSVTTWQNLLRFLAADGLPLAALQVANADVAGVRRWGYAREESGRLVLTWAGKVAHRIWTELEPAIERRWRERLGAAAVGALRTALAPFVAELTALTPRGLPALGFGDGGRMRAPTAFGPASGCDAPDLDLGTLLARAVLASTVAYERDAQLPAVLGFDVIEPLADAGGSLTRAELTRASGLATETVTALAGWLVRGGYVTQSRAGRAVVLTLTRRGADAAAAHTERAVAAQGELERMLGAEASALLAGVLDGIRSDAPALRQTLEPQPGSWRSRPPYAARTAALLADPAGLLPRHPAVTHRGGFPDGA